MYRTFIVMTAIAFALSTAACGGAQTKADTAKAGGPSAQKLPETATCPVMQREFKPDAKTVSTTYKGKTYYFCCPGCDKKFAAAPDKYLAAGPAAAAAPKKDCKGDCTKDCADCKSKVAKKDCGKDCNNGKDCADCKNKAAAGPKPMTAGQLGTTLPKKAKCPVSGREFEPNAQTQVAKYKGKTYYFCCGGCAGKFASTPAKFATN